MWYQLQIEDCPSDKVEVLSEALEETGALSITLTDKNNDPILEPAPGSTPLWPEVLVCALYEKEQGASRAKALIAATFCDLSYSINSLADQDWERAWMDEFKPMRFGQRLWICPSWSKPPEPEAVNLILDPGLAFGTGTHPTTALCLNWLAQADLTNKRVIDYGCGSGILALAALKLGAAKVEAVDIDEQALEATANNALRSAINSQQLVIGFPDILQGGADLLITNILLAPLLSLRTKFKALFKPKGILVVSGLLAEQVPQLIAAYQDDFRHQATEEQEGWALTIFNPRD